MHLKQEKLKYENVYNGDIFGFSAPTKFGGLIQKATNHNCQHVAFAMWEQTGLYLIEAHEDGIRKVFLSDFLKEYEKEHGEEAKLWHFALDKRIRDKFSDTKFYKFVRSALGKKYDWIQAAFSGIDHLDGIGITKNKECDKHYFCSELCCRMLEESTGAFNCNCSEKTPADVCMMKIYSTYYSSQIMGKSTYLRKFNYIEINQK